MKSIILIIALLLLSSCEIDTREITAECISGCDDFQIKVNVGGESFTIDVFEDEVNIW